MKQFSTGIGYVFFFFYADSGYRSTCKFVINALCLHILILIKNNKIIPTFTLFPTFVIGLKSALLLCDSIVHQGKIRSYNTAGKAVVHVMKKGRRCLKFTQHTESSPLPDTFNPHPYIWLCSFEGLYEKANSKLPFVFLTSLLPQFPPI